MIAVVVDASKVGVTGWVAVRSTRELVCKGLVKGEIAITFDTNDIMRIREDCRELLPPGATRVKAEIIEIEDSRVFIDLE